ncbi:hypothetical protein FXO37_19607 [Capsicum annuum]|nr:hypothetical protein FXO37_19607 [Capsicum annuum]
MGRKIIVPKQKDNTAGSSRKRRTATVEKVSKIKKIEESVFESDLDLKEISDYVNSSEDIAKRSVSGDSKECEESGSNGDDGDNDSLSVPYLSRCISVKWYDLRTIIDEVGSFPAKISVRSTMAAYREFKQIFVDQKLKKRFKRFCFGHLRNLPEHLKFNGQLVHYFLLQRVKNDKIHHEMWFCVNNNPACFVLKEFCLITELKCSSYSSESKMKKVFFEKYPWAKETFQLTMDYLKNKSDLKKQKEVFDEKQKASYALFGFPWAFMNVHPYIIPTVHEMKMDCIITFEPYTDEVKNNVLDGLKKELEGVTVLTLNEDSDDDGNLGGNPVGVRVADDDSPSTSKDAAGTSSPGDLHKHVAALEEEKEEEKKDVEKDRSQEEGGKVAAAAEEEESVADEQGGTEKEKTVEEEAEKTDKEEVEQEAAGERKEEAEEETTAEAEEEIAAAGESHGQSLTYLDISFTRVGGTVPPSLSNSTSLTVSLANGCSIQVSIPSSITKLKKLRILMLNDNNITGQLPVSMSSLTSLQHLSMFQNGLRGYIPTSICQILSLEYLNKEWNELTGRLPSCILQLPKISYLSVQKNNLNGNMPLFLFQKSRLDQISFGVGGLSVEIDDRDQSYVQTFQTSPYYKIQELNLGTTANKAEMPSWVKSIMARLDVIDSQIMDRMEGRLEGMEDSLCKKLNNFMEHQSLPNQISVSGHAPHELQVDRPSVEYILSSDSTLSYGSHDNQLMCENGDVEQVGRLIKDDPLVVFVVDHSSIEGIYDCIGGSLGERKHVLHPCPWIPYPFDPIDHLRCDIDSFQTIFGNDMCALCEDDYVDAKHVLYVIWVSRDRE